MSIRDNINSVKDLINYLEKKGRNHKNYHHYTTWDSVKEIYNSKSFLLTRGNSLRINDQHEAIMKGAYKEWNKTYIASFSYGASENMAMWGLYGVPGKDAVRITIPQKAMLLWLESIKNIKVWNQSDGNHSNRCLEYDHMCLNDVVYASGEKDERHYRLTHYNRHCTVINEKEFYRFDESPRMTGYIKNYAWHYENEVRLKINLPFDVQSEKIIISIPADTIKSFEITTGPCFEYKDDSIFHELTKKLVIHPSGFEHLVKYKPLCSLCEYGEFQRKV